MRALRRAVKRHEILLETFNEIFIEFFIPRKCHEIFTSLGLLARLPRTFVYFNLVSAVSVT